MTAKKPAKPVAGKLRAPSRATWMREFLSALAETSNVTAADAKARITQSHVYKTRRSDREFARLWQAALCEGYDNLELELLQRLRSGDEPADKARKFDNSIAFRLLTAHRESAAQHRAIRDNEDADAVIASINAKLDLMRERAIAAGEYREVEE